MNMKKTLLAAAVAAVVAAPAASYADATLYGKVQYALTQAGKTTDSGKATTTFGDNGNRLGVKGSDMLGDGLTSFYKIEFDIKALGDATTSYKSTVSSSVYARYAYAGVKGGFGTAVGGRIADLFYGMVEAPTDTPNVIGGSLGPTGSGYTSRVDGVAYMSPDMGGFTGGVAIGTIGTSSADGTQCSAFTNGYCSSVTTVTNSAKQQQVYELGGKYSFGPGYVSAAYLSIPKNNIAINEDSGVKSVAGIAGGYSFGMFGIDANVTKTGAQDSDYKAAKITQATLQGSMSMGALYSYVMYSQAKSSASDSKTANQVTAGVFYNVSKPLMVSFEVASANKYTNSSIPSSSAYSGQLVSNMWSSSNVNGKSNTSVALGLAYSF